MEKQIHSETIKDKYHMVYILFYGLGTLSLVPVHFFPTATDYWLYKFRDPDNTNYSNSNSENRTELQAQFTSDISIVSHVGSIAFILLTFTLLRNISVLKRLIGSLGGVVIMFAITVLFVEIDTDTWQRGFFVFTLLTAFTVTAFGSICMATLFEMVPKFPPQYLPILLSGQAICGILSALLQIMSLSSGLGSKTNGLIYFLIGLSFVSLVFVYFLITLRTSKFFIYYFNRETSLEKVKITKDSMIGVIKKIKFYILSLMMVAGSSSMIQPGVTSLVVSVDKGNGNKWNDVYFVPVVTFFLYNMCDYIGRESANFLKKPKNGVIILVLGLLRIALIPMLMLCNAHPRHHLPVVFDIDAVYIIFILVLGFTNGFFINLCVVRVPMVTTPEERKSAVVVVFVIMLVSLGICSFISAALVKLL